MTDPTNAERQRRWRERRRMKGRGLFEVEIDNGTGGKTRGWLPFGHAAQVLLWIAETKEAPLT